MAKKEQDPKVSPLRQLIENRCEIALEEILQRWVPGGTIHGRYYEAASLSGGAGSSFRFDLSYHNFEDTYLDAHGRGMVELRAVQLGVSPASAINIIAHELGIKDVLKNEKEKLAEAPDGDKGVIYPVPAEVPLPDWEGAMKDPATWRKLGSPLAPSRVWTWRDSDNQLIGYTCRFDRPGGAGKFFRRLMWHGPAVGWAFGEFSRPFPIYGSELLTSDVKRVLVVEGEKACDAARQLFPGLAVITWPGGSNWARHSQWRCLRNRDVVIVPDQDVAGEKAAASIADMARRNGASTVSVLDLAGYNLPHGWDVADKVPSGCNLDIKAEIEGAFDVPPQIAALNKDYFVVDDNGKVVVMREVKDQALNGRRRINRYTFTDFRNYFCDEEVIAGTDLKGLPILRDLGDFWLTHRKRRKYADITCDPRGAPANVYNLWQGFSVEPADGHWDFLVGHIRENIAQGDQAIEDYVLNWLAFAVQRPADPPGVALVLRGARGTGKGILFRALGHLFGQHFLHVSNARHLTGNFNAHLRDAVVVFADEAFWAGDKQGESTLKTLITEPTLIVEGKGRDSVTSRNMVHLCVASNSDWVVPAGPEERRFCVLDIGRKHMQDAPYFRRMQEQLDGGGYAAMLQDLLRRDISTFNPAEVPQSQALLDQKLDSLGAVESWWHHRLVTENLLEFREGWPNQVGCQELYKDFLDYCSRSNRSSIRMSPEAFGRSMSKMVKALGKIRQDIDVVVPGLAGDLPTGRKTRAWCYYLPNLAGCRRDFEDMLRQSMDWEASDEF